MLAGAKCLNYSLELSVLQLRDRIARSDVRKIGIAKSHLEVLINLVLSSNDNIQYQPRLKNTHQKYEAAT